MRKPLAREACSSFKFVGQINGRLILLSSRQCMDSSAIPLTLFHPLPYHPPHATGSCHLLDSHDGGRMGCLP